MVYRPEMLPPTLLLKNQTWKMRQMMKLMQRRLTLMKKKKKKKKWMIIKTVGLPNDVIFRKRVKCCLSVENDGQL